MKKTVILTLTLAMLITASITAFALNKGNENAKEDVPTEEVVHNFGIPLDALSETYIQQQKENPFIYSVNSDAYFGKDALEDAMDRIDEFLNEAKIDDSLGSECDEHNLVKDREHTTAIFTNINGYPCHLKGYYDTYICSECGHIEYSENLFRILEHNFVEWHYTGNDEHEGKSHSFEYESYCSVCGQYCLKTVTVPCTETDCVTAEEYIES